MKMIKGVLRWLLSNLGRLFDIVLLIMALLAIIDERFVVAVGIFILVELHDITRLLNKLTQSPVTTRGRN